MKFLIASFVLLIGSTYSTYADANGEGDLWVMVVGPMCLAQNPVYQDTNLGKLFSADGGMADFRQRPYVECFRKRKWASEELCHDLMLADESALKNVQSIYDKHHTEIRGMKSAFSYFNAYLNVWKTKEMPSCPTE